MQRQRLTRGIAMAGFAAMLAVLASSGGCELAVPGDVPRYSCKADVRGDCPADSVCVPATSECVPIATTCEGTPCTGGLACDSMTLTCMPLALLGDGSTSGDDASGSDATLAMGDDAAGDGSNDARADAPVTPLEAGAPPADATAEAAQACGVGCKCGSPLDCTTGICADDNVETTALYTANGDAFMCTKPCCSSADCPGATVCFGTGAGGNYCVPAARLGRSATLGEGLGGATCSANSDCRSGLCSAGACADTCCSSQQTGVCAAGSVCRFATFPGAGFDTHQTAWCGSAIGTVPAGGVCGGLNADMQCASGKCGSLGRCESVCRSSTDCAAGQACTYSLGPSFTTNTDTDIVAGCGASAGGPGGDGASCNSNADCVSAFCDGTQCTDVCFSDADCTKAGWRCRPEQVKTQFSNAYYSILSCGT